MSSCNRCYEYSWRKEECDCKEYFVSDEDGYFDNAGFWSRDAEGAAINAAKSYNDEGDLMGESRSFTVLKPDKTVEVYSVSAEVDVHYSARLTTP